VRLTIFEARNPLLRENEVGDLLFWSRIGHGVTLAVSLYGSMTSSKRCAAAS